MLKRRWFKHGPTSNAAFAMAAMPTVRELWLIPLPRDQSANEETADDFRINNAASFFACFTTRLARLLRLASLAGCVAAKNCVFAVSARKNARLKRAFLYGTFSDGASARVG